jgi:hypothetical protein
VKVSQQIDARKCDEVYKNRRRRRSGGKKGRKV